MHEFGTAQQIVKTVTRVGLQNKAKKVTVVHLEIGQLTFLVPDQLKFSFDIASRGTIAEGAKFIITHLKAKTICKNCNYTGELNLQMSGDTSIIEANLKMCPKCNKIGLEIIGGRELNIKNIKVEM